jgi:hypothetical protein
MAVEENGSSEKIAWTGRIMGVQPRIRLTRSFDERSHSYLGYVLDVDGTCGVASGRFLIAVGKAAQEKHQFRTGMEASGVSVPVDDARMETAGLYKTSEIRVLAEPQAQMFESPPFYGVAPDLEVYRSRGHRRLDAKTYGTKCSTCMWGCRMPVEMIITSGTRLAGNTDWRPSATVPRAVPCIGRARRARSLAGGGCPTRRKTGWMRTRPVIGMIKVGGCRIDQGPPLTKWVSTH